MSYPSRLEQELADRFPGVDIRVINHGVGGQDVGEADTPPLGARPPTATLLNASSGEAQ